MIEVYTDGACSQNGTWEGGFAAVLVVDNKEVKSVGGKELNTTNNRMELRGLLAGIDLILEEGSHGFIYTDSAYIHNAVTKGWLTNWTRNGWVNSKRQPVANKDLWQEVSLKIKEHGNMFNIEKVKGHADNDFNNRADKLAVQWRNMV